VESRRIASPRLIKNLSPVNNVKRKSGEMKVFDFSMESNAQKSMLSFAAQNAKNIGREEESKNSMAEKMLGLEINTELNSEQVIDKIPLNSFANSMIHQDGEKLKRTEDVEMSDVQPSQSSPVNFQQAIRLPNLAKI